MLDEAIQRAPQIVPAKGNPGKIHILHGLIQGRVFDGQFEAQGRTYQFSFVPTSASIVEHRLVLKGRFVLSSPTRRTEGADRILVDNVEATLVATQGGVGPLAAAGITYGSRTGYGSATRSKLSRTRAGNGIATRPACLCQPEYDELGTDCRCHRPAQLRRRALFCLVAAEW